MNLQGAEITFRAPQHLSEQQVGGGDLRCGIAPRLDLAARCAEPTVLTRRQRCLDALVSHSRLGDDLGLPAPPGGTTIRQTKVPGNTVGSTVAVTDSPRARST